MPRSRTAGVPRVETFALEPGRVIAGKYEVLSKLGEGWEGEVYLIRERVTGIHRAAKCFFPQRNVADRAARFYARKLHKLRHCPLVIQYHGRETFLFRRVPITVLVSEFVEGEMLAEFLARQAGGRLPVFAGLHLLHALAVGIEEIHRRREYHGDLHAGNVMVRRFGLGFDLKVLDLYRWESPRPENIREDVVDMVRIFFDAIGGRPRYRSQPPEVKDICRGMRRDLILERFRSAGDVRRHLEGLEWS